jgi:deoxyadenosine/deoxycytidine kinase
MACENWNVDTVAKAVPRLPMSQQKNAEVDESGRIARPSRLGEVVISWSGSHIECLICTYNQPAIFKKLYKLSFVTILSSKYPNIHVFLHVDYSLPSLPSRIKIRDKQQEKIGNTS